MSMDYEYQTREARRAAEDEESSSGSVPFKRLRGPVGIRRGVQVTNAVADQLTVMDLLNNVSTSYGGNRKGDGSLEVVLPLPIAGRCHVVLWTMILRVQNHFHVTGELGFVPDGVIDPSGRTERLLMEYRGDEPPYPASDPKQLAIAVIPLALRWATGASAYLLRYKVWQMGGRAWHFDTSAADTHLHINKLPPGPAAIARIDEWMQNYVLIAGALEAAATVFVRASREEALAARLEMNCWGVMVPAWARPNIHIWFGPDMIGLGPKCRAAILLHEAGHYIRAKIGHTGGERGAQYDAQSADDALRSAYVCANFATHAATGRDERFGLARRFE